MKRLDLFGDFPGASVAICTCMFVTSGNASTESCCAGVDAEAAENGCDYNENQAMLSALSVRCSTTCAIRLP